MEGLKEQLSVKGTKCNLQFSTKERQFFEQECGFTDEELVIFRLRSRGRTVLQISFEMEDILGKELQGRSYSVSKVEARIRSIKSKILNIL